MLQAAGMVPGSGGAAELLGRIGVWGPHDNIGLRQAGLTADFPPALQAWLPATAPLLMPVPHILAHWQTSMSQLHHAGMALSDSYF